MSFDGILLRSPGTAGDIYLSSYPILIGESDSTINLTVSGSGYLTGEADVYVQSLLSNHKSLWSDETHSASVRTADANQTKLASLTGLNNNETWLIKAVIHAVAKSTEDYLFIVLNIMAHHNGSNIILSTVTSPFTALESSPTNGWSADFNVDGDNINIDVIGQSGVIVDWYLPELSISRQL